MQILEVALFLGAFLAADHVFKNWEDLSSRVDREGTQSLQQQQIMESQPPQALSLRNIQKCEPTHLSEKAQKFQKNLSLLCEFNTEDPEKAKAHDNYPKTPPGRTPYVPRSSFKRKKKAD